MTAEASGRLLEADVVVRRRAFSVAARFDLAPGERLALFGSSGAGKTTMLEAVAGLAELERGHALLDGVLIAGKVRGSRRFPARLRRVGLVRQPTTLFPHLSVGDNLAYCERRSARRAAPLAGPQLLEAIGLAGLERARPQELSGGQRQRVALGRALATDYRLLLLDEPFSAIDGPSRRQLRDVVVEQALEREAATVLVTHDLAEAQGFGHRLGVVEGGRLLQLGPPDEVVRRPATLRVAALLGYESFVHAPGLADGQVVALHPDAIELGANMDHGIVLEGTVAAVDAIGLRFANHVALGSGEVVVVRTSTPLAPGATVQLTARDAPVVADGDATADERADDTGGRR